MTAPENAAVHLGEGGDHLVAEVAGDEVEERLRAALVYAHPTEWNEEQVKQRTTMLVKQAREAGLEQARLRRLALHRRQREDHTKQGPADVV